MMISIVAPASAGIFYSRIQLHLHESEANVFIKIADIFIQNFYIFFIR